MNGLLWKISVALARRSGFANMLLPFICPRSRLIAQKRAFMNSLDASKMRRLLRSVKCCGVNASKAFFVIVVGLLEFDREMAVVRRAVLKSPLSCVVFGYIANLQYNRLR